jgi:hypothetical protein
MMRIMNRHGSVALLLTIALAGCSYEKNAVQDITRPPSGAFVRFANFSVGAPNVNFYANNDKLTAVSSVTGTESTLGTAAGACATSTVGLYSTIAPGAYDLTGRISATVDKDLPISKVTTTIENGKYYTYYQSGIYNSTTKTSDAFVVQDPIPAAFDYTTAYVRFVNASSTASPMTLYAKDQTTTTETAVGAEVAYKAAGAFTMLPTGVYDLNTRVTGSATNVVTRLGVTFAVGRVYTVTLRNATATTYTLDNTVNR